MYILTTNYNLTTNILIHPFDIFVKNANFGRGSTPIFWVFYSFSGVFLADFSYFYHYFILFFVFFV